MNQTRELGKQIFVINYLQQMTNMAECLTWFALRDKIVNKLLSKYLNSIIGMHDHESKILFDRYNICHKIILNQELIHDEVTINELLNLCPDEHWRVMLNIEFILYEANDPNRNNLNMLYELKRNTFIAFKHCTGFANFRREVNIKSENIQSMLGEIYDEIQRRQEF